MIVRTDEALSGKLLYQMDRPCHPHTPEPSHVFHMSSRKDTMPVTNHWRFPELPRRAHPGPATVGVTEEHEPLGPRGPYGGRTAK